VFKYINVLENLNILEKYYFQKGKNYKKEIIFSVKFRGQIFIRQNIKTFKNINIKSF